VSAGYVKWLVVCLVLLGGIVLAAQRLPAGSDLRIEVENATHAPVFGVIALLLLAATRKRLGAVLNREEAIYGAAIAATLLAGIATEIVQSFAGQDAEAGDVVRDFVGGTAFLSFYCTFDRSVVRTRVNRTLRNRVLMRSAAIAMMAVVLGPAVLQGLAVLHRNRQFPMLMDFESPLDHRLCRAVTSALQIIRDPRPGAVLNSNRVGQVTFRPGRYSTFALPDPYPDWTGFGHLRFTISADLSHPVSLVLRINDAGHDETFKDRFNEVITIQPGDNEVDVLLENVKHAPASRLMDMSRIRLVSLFAMDVTAGFSVTLDDIRLLRD
jgi:hypothetical protein